MCICRSVLSGIDSTLCNLGDGKLYPYVIPNQPQCKGCHSQGGILLPIGLAARHLNGDYNYADGPEGEYLEETTPVDHFKLANAWGLSDMHGNVFEWCQDEWHNSYEGAPEDGSAWVAQTETPSTEESEDVTRIIRGGSWINYPGDCRSASRSDTDPRGSINLIGFRVVCSAPRALS